MKPNKIIALTLAAVMALGLLAGCGSKAPGGSQSGSVSQSGPVDEEDYTTGDASLDDPRNQDGIGETELLVVSFGTSFNDSRRLTIGAIEQALEDAFPDWSVRRGFTAQIVIDHIQRRDGEVIDNVTQALDRAADNGVKRLIVQPTHLMDGFEYSDLVDEVAQYADAFESIQIGKPLLTSDEDFKLVAQAMKDATAQYDDGKTAICFMGHGTEAESNAVYAKMQQVMTDAGYANYFVGTVEAAPSLDDVLNAVKAGEYERVVLQPMMIVAGDHANNDMAGDGEDSWKSAFEKEGYQVECVLKGLGEYEAIRQIFVDHVRDAAGPDTVPVYGDSLRDGTYPVTVDSSSSMFNIEACELTVAGGKMTAVMHMGGKGYLSVFMGTGEEAAQAPETATIPFAEDETGAHTFTVPVEALDTDIPCAALSKKKGTWYDRTLVFRADSLPPEAFREGAYPTEDSLKLADGSYTVEVELAGGSGKASVQSPAELRVEGGQAIATLVWSSSNYDYMRVGEEKYLPISTEGGSTFEIPVSVFDRELTVYADTTAMSTPHEIEYTLKFFSDTIEQAQ